jgi:hypothetical protein
MKALVIFALLALACVPILPPAPPVPPGEPSCATACRRMQDLHCPEGGNTPAGASCLNVCWDAENEGLTLPVRCLTNATSCEAAERCQ